MVGITTKTWAGTMKPPIIESELERLLYVPFLHINPYLKERKIADIYVALLHVLPTDSHKALAAKSMIEVEERKRQITPDTVFIDHSTGNTAAAEAWVCSIKGYKYICFIPENMASEKIQQIKACGGEIKYTPAENFITGAKKAAAEFQQQDPKNRIYLNQAANPASPEGYKPIAQKIIELFPRIDAYVCGAGTYSTITGVSSVLRQHKPDIQVTCIEASYAPHIHALRKGYKMRFIQHNLIGFGAETLPPNAKPDLYDNIVLIDEPTSIQKMKELHKMGLLIGKTSAANICWAEKIARELGPGKIVVTNSFDSFSKSISEQIY